MSGVLGIGSDELRRTLATAKEFLAAGGLAVAVYNRNLGAEQVDVPVMVLAKTKDGVLRIDPRVVAKFNRRKIKPPRRGVRRVKEKA